MTLAVASAAERPELIDRAWERTRDLLPEHNNHGDVLNRYWGQLIEELPLFQFHLVEGDEPVARARSLPIRRDGSVDDLPAGIDGAIARTHGLSVLIAPVRPSWKERHPLTPIERYAGVRRPEDGLPFDPWMRVHERLGAEVLKPEPESLRITGTVAEWIA